MALLLSGEQPPLAAATRVSPLRAMLNWLAKSRQARARRLALRTLLDYDQSRLDDLGINRHDLFEALEPPVQQPGTRLAQRRAASSRLWLDP